MVARGVKPTGVQYWTRGGSARVPTKSPPAWSRRAWKGKGSWHVQYWTWKARLCYGGGVEAGETKKPAAPSRGATGWVRWDCRPAG
jgi:hypothetical protein